MEKADLDVSSSDIDGISTSLRSEERNDGALVVSRCCRISVELIPLAGRFEGPGNDELDDDPVVSKTLRVLGRFSFRSGSFGGSDDRSAGEAVTDLDFRLRLLGLAVSISLAFSKAPHALLSSTLSTGVCDNCARTLGGAASRKICRAPWRPAIFRRCCHCWNSRRCSAVRRWCLL